MVNNTIVFASNNPGKVRELQLLLDPFLYQVIPQATLNITEAPETAVTFVENALLKARHACKIAGLPALADDSGLAVSALQNAPGIYSARFAGKHATSHRNIEKLLDVMQHIPEPKRMACFHCVLVFMTHAEDPTPLICHGTWQGSILFSPQGENGFGYDPIFYVPSENKSAAELTIDVKNRISHRGQALRMLIEKLPQKLRDDTC